MIKLRFAQRGLFFRLYAYFIIVISISASILGTLIYKEAVGKLEEQLQANMDQVINNATHHTELYIRAYENSTLSVIASPAIKQFLNAPTLSGYEYFEYGRALRDSVFDTVFIRHPEVLAAYLVRKDGQFIAGFNGITGLPADDPGVEEHIRHIIGHTRQDGRLSTTGSGLTTVKEGPAITLYRKVGGYAYTSEEGVLAIEVKSTELSTLWKGINLSQNGYLMITDPSGSILYHTDANRIGTAFTGYNDLPEDAGSFSGDYEGEERDYVSRVSDLTGWRLAVSIPTAELRVPMANIRTKIWIIALCTSLLPLLMAFRFSRSISRPIDALKAGMSQTERGEWTLIPLQGKRDELDDLIHRYNIMVKRLSELVSEVYEADLNKREALLERKNAEFQALQLQINPHFIYNTLETVVCYNVVQESKEITDIVKSLAYMLRYAVQTSLDEITVANELKHVLNYMTIMKYRLDREFELEVEVPPELLLKKLVRVTLQPLIENVFQHAFADGVEEHHRIRLSAEIEDDLFIFTVEDNGVGMEEGDLFSLRQRLTENKLGDVKAKPGGGSGGIGILNVHRRIQMVFGEQYGLQIESRPGCTKVKMVMPNL